MRIIICDKNSKDAESMSSILKKNNILSAGAIEVQTLDSCDTIYGTNKASERMNNYGKR
jgi:hypothetical protein